MGCLFLQENRALSSLGSGVTFCTLPVRFLLSVGMARGVGTVWFVRLGDKGWFLYTQVHKGIASGEPQYPSQRPEAVPGEP